MEGEMTMIINEMAHELAFRLRYWSTNYGVMYLSDLYRKLRKYVRRKIRRYTDTVQVTVNAVALFLSLETLFLFFCIQHDSNN